MESDAEYIERLEEALNDAVALLMKVELKLADTELELANEKQRVKNQAQEIRVLCEELTGGA